MAEILFKFHKNLVTASDRRPFSTNKLS